jgi:tRNA A37 threonylcarbamoyltransferase TsaD
MDLLQLTKLVQFIDEERRKDRVLIAQLQEQVAGLMQEAEARTRYAQSLETALNELKLQVMRALGWTSANEQLRQEFAQVIERIEDQRAKAERELVRPPNRDRIPHPPVERAAQRSQALRRLR